MFIDAIEGIAVLKDTVFAELVGAIACGPCCKQVTVLDQPRQMLVDALARHVIALARIADDPGVPLPDSLQQPFANSA